MDRYFADWYREIVLNIDEPTLEKRWSSIESITKKRNKVDEFVCGLLKVFFGLPSDNQNFNDELAGIFKNSDATFPMRSNNKELQILSGATISHLIQNKSEKFSSLLSFAVMCGGLQATRKVLINDVFTVAEEFLRTTSIKLRQPLHPDIIEGNKLDLTDELNELNKQIQGNIFVNSQPQFETLIKKIQHSVNSISSAQNNAARIILLQQEEIDFLWWIINSSSKYYQKHFTELGISTACLVIPKELADITQVLPGPSTAAGFIDSALSKFTEEERSGISIQKIVNEAPREWRKDIVANVNADPLLPLHFAITKSLETESLKDWISLFESKCKLKASKKLVPSLMSNQFYQERLLLKGLTEESRK